MNNEFNNKTINRERFKNTATKRTINVLKALKILSNCANRNIYKYKKEDIDKIFKTIEQKVAETKAKFSFGESNEFKL